MKANTLAGKDTIMICILERDLYGENSGYTQMTQCTTYISSVHFQEHSKISSHLRSKCII